MATRRHLAALEGHAQEVYRIAFHPGGELLVTASVDGTSRLWDAGTGRQLVNQSPGIADMHFSRDGAVCGFVAIDGRARLVEVADGREYRTFVGSLGAGRGGYYQGDIGADGLLAVGMDDGTRLWDLAAGREVAFLPDRQTDSVSFVTRPEGRELLTCGFGGLRRWPIHEDPEAPGRLRIGPPHTVQLPVLPTRADGSPDGRTVAVASERSGTATVLDWPTEAVRCILEPHPALGNVVLSPDDRWVVTSGWHTPSVKVWDARTGALVKELRLGKINSATFSPDGRTLVTSRGDEYVFWDVATWRPVRRLPWEIPDYPGWVAFSPDRKLLALERSPAVIHLIDAATGRTLAKLEDARSDRAQWLSFTPDGAQLVAISTYSKAIHVWDLRAIRRQLAAMDLDWGSPPFPLDPGAEARRPLAVESLLGELSSPEHAAEERARRDIESYRLAVESQPDSASACNNLAWAYATAPEPLRDPTRALALAERAAELSPHDPLIRNTLGVAYYRAGRYREAADTLRANLPVQQEKFLASDLYFLAMSHHQLGEVAVARAYYTWAGRPTRSQAELPAKEVQEEAAFRAEAELLMEK